MKKYILSILSICFTLSFSSCNDLLDKNPLEYPSSEDYYKNKTEVELGLNGCYKQLCWDLKDSRPWPVIFDVTTDISWNRSSHGVQTLGNGSAISNNSAATAAWKQLYKGIARCNFLLNNIDRAEGLTEDYYNQTIAEARFIRALNYSLLVELFGDVPKITVVQDINNMNTAKTSKAEMVEWILQELDEAKVYLPISYADEKVKGRATKVAALGIKARLALYNGKFQIAADAAKEAMNAGYYSLHPKYEELFNYDGEYSKEIIFSLQYLKGVIVHGNSNFLASRLAKGVSNEVPTQSMVDSYECTDGLTIDKSPLFDPQNPYENRDPRLAKTIAYPGSIYYGYEFQVDGVKYPKVWNYNVTPAKQVANTDGTNTYATFTTYLWRKWADPRDMDDDENCDADIVVIRLAEIYLIYAEAMIELNQIDQSVLDAINKVRARAYEVDYTQTDKYPAITTTNQAKLREVIRRERKIELANEGHRLFDIRRWGIAEKVMSGDRLGGIKTEPLANAPKIDENTTPDYSNVTNKSKMRVLEKMVFDPKKDYLWPIPLSEIETNKLLEQNPNW